MSKKHPNLAIKSLADLHRRKEQLQLETLAAKQAVLDSAKPLQAKTSGLLLEKVIPVVAIAAGLGIAYQIFGRKKVKTVYAAVPAAKPASPWVTLAKFAWPLLKTALPLLQNWYSNYHKHTAKPHQ